MGHRAGRGGERWASGLLRAGGPCHFCVRPWAARVLPWLLRCALRGLALSGLRGGLSPRSLRRPWVGLTPPWSRVCGV